MKRLLNYTVELDGTEYNCVVDVDFHVDPNYGADADGNRGAPRRFIDDVKLIDVFTNYDNQFKSIDPGDTLRELILSKIDDQL